MSAQRWTSFIWFLSHMWPMLLTTTQDLRTTYVYKNTLLGTKLIPPESLEHIRHARAHNEDMIEDCVLLSLWCLLPESHWTVASRSVVTNSLAWWTAQPGANTRVDDDKMSNNRWCVCSQNFLSRLKWVCKKEDPWERTERTSLLCTIVIMKRQKRQERSWIQSTHMSGKNM